MVVAVMMLGLVQTAMLAVAAEDLSSWQKRMPITFSGYTPPGGGTLTNFPVLVILNNTNAGVGFNYSEFLSPPYGDLRFAAADKTTPLDYEVESWASNGLSYAWVRVPTLNSNVTIYVLWGQSGVTAPACTTNGAVWTSGFSGVWHLSQTTGAALDATPNLNNGTLSASGVTRGATGTVDGAFTFSNPGNLDCGTNVSLNVGYASWEAWVFPTDFSGWDNVLDKGFNNAYWFGLSQTTGKIRLHCGGGASSAPAHDSTSAVPLNQWSHIMSTWDGQNVRHYINGVLNTTIAETTAPRTNATKVTHIGAYFSDGTGASSALTGYFPGRLDEIRLSNVPRGSNWVWACFMNTASNGVFNNYGAPEFQNLPAVNNANGATNITWTSAYLNGTLLATGTSSATVFAYWGTSDGGTNIWANTNTWAAPPSPGGFTAQVTGLSSNTTYYYRFAATNQAGVVWAFTSSVFITGDVWIDKLSDASEIGPTPGTFTVHRASAATNESLIVNYIVSGTASNGVDYATLNGSILMPAGTDSVSLVVSPYFDHIVEGTETVQVTVASGSYVMGALSNAAMGIADAGTVTLTWNGAGANALASNPANWVGGVAPVAGDAVNLDATTNKNMTWDLTIPVQTWTQVGYAGTVTVSTVYGATGFTNLNIIGNCVISNGVWTHNGNTTTEANRLRVTIGGDLIVGPNGVVDVTGKGYSSGNGPGANAGSWGQGSY